jgi:hypothetical protein
MPEFGSIKIALVYVHITDLIWLNQDLVNKTEILKMPFREKRFIFMRL